MRVRELSDGAVGAGEPIRSCSPPVPTPARRSRSPRSDRPAALADSHARERPHPGPDPAMAVAGGRPPAARLDTVCLYALIPCATAWMLSCSCSALSSSCEVAGFEVEHDLLHRPREGVRRLVLVGAGRRRGRCRGSRPCRRRRTAASAPSCSTRPSPICSPFAQSVTSPPVPGFGSSASNSIFDAHVARRERRRRRLLVALDAEERVGVVEHALLVDPEPEPADEVGVRDDDALGAAVGHRRAPPRSRRSVRRSGGRAPSGRSGRRRRTCSGSRSAAAAGCRRSTQMRAEQRQHVVALRLLPEELLQLRELLRVLGREVLRLREVVRQVVELPRVLARDPTWPGPNGASVAGEKSHGALSSRAQAHQPSL